MIHPIMAQALAPWAPLAKPHDPQASGFDLSGLLEYAYTTDTGFTLRCYLEHDEAVVGGGDAHPNASEKVWLVYAFAGATDVFELVEQVPGLQAKIEAEALAHMKAKDKQANDDIAIARWEERQAA